MGRVSPVEKKGICSKSVRNVGTSSTAGFFCRSQVASKSKSNQ